MIGFKKSFTLVMVLVALHHTNSFAVLSYSGCKDLAVGDFKIKDLLTNGANQVDEPMKMDFDLLAGPTEDAKDKVDIYFTQRLGKLRKFDSKTKTVIEVWDFNLKVDASGSDGLMGIALDPLFKTNHRVFLYYSYLTATKKTWRVSRFNLNAANDKLDTASQKVIIEIPILGASKHPGGALKFDASGDLWITTGNDYRTGKDFPVWTSANTNDLRGKILRITPKEDGGYTIPNGNLFPKGTALTLPEIYVMGARNPYTLSLDPVRKWALWGDVGPDNADMDGKSMNNGGKEKTEEYNLTKAPGNYGYPFFSGDLMTKSGMVQAAPVIPAGLDWNGVTPGLLTLPPAITPIFPYKKSCAIGGPLYRYNGALNSTVKFPPHLTRKWLVTDWNTDGDFIKTFTLDDKGDSITANENLPGVQVHGPLDMQFGPDGALYILNYGAGNYRFSSPSTGLVRVDYTPVDCHPALPLLETSSSVRNKLGRQRGTEFAIVQTREVQVDVYTIGDFKLEVRDILGRPIAERLGQGVSHLILSEIQKPGIYFISVSSSEGQTTRKLIRE